MKQSYELSQDDIKQAIREWVANRAKIPCTVTVTLDAEQRLDYMDRATGGYTITATATVEDPKP